MCQTICDEHDKTIGITLTGADERTPVDRLVQFAERGAEIGLLYTFSPDGRNRYPRIGWIMDVLYELKGRVAIHVCGERARKSLIAGRLFTLTDGARRVQVNGVLTTSSVQMLSDSLPLRTIITQHVKANSGLLYLDLPNHALLMDGSGGRGILPQSWSRPETAKPVGFAGGLGPQNLAEQLPQIAAVARGKSWIDMEQKLRNNADWFDVGLAQAALDQWLLSDVSH